jgi:CheY-like chemotaxis protein
MTDKHTAAAQAPRGAPKLLLIGRDRDEGERVRRLLSYGAAAAHVAVCTSPCEGRSRLRREGTPDVVLLEDRTWPEVDTEALEELRALCTRRAPRVGLILSRRIGESQRGAKVPRGVPVVERPYRLDELFDALRLAMLRSGT